MLLFIADGLQGAAVHPENTTTVAPHSASVAAAGVQITRAYTPLPTCSPARASLMTGLLPHSHGVLQVEHVVDEDQSVLRSDTPHWASHLQAAGYRTGFFGSALQLAPPPPSPGPSLTRAAFAEWHIERSLELGRFGWSDFEALGAQAHRAASEQGAKEEVALTAGLSRFHSGPAGYNDNLH